MCVSLTLPNPQSQNYSNNRQGRLAFERPLNLESQLNEVLSLKSGNSFESKQGLVRGMSGGIIYLHEDGFLLQSKHYPKTGDRYFSGFSGLSSSLADIRDPMRIAVREGIEELVIQYGNEFLFADLSKSPSFKTYNHEELKEFASKGIQLWKKRQPAELLTVDLAKVSSLDIEVINGSDRLTILNDEGRVLSVNNYIIDVNPGSNCFDFLKAIKIPKLPNNLRFYEAEFGNSVTFIPFEQMQDLWKNWQGTLNAFTYLPNGRTENVRYPALMDSLVQSVAMHLNVIEKGEKRLDYKQYSKSF